MFISDKLVYLALHKTGCSHTIKLLSSVKELNGKIIGKHNTIYDVSPQELGNLEQKIKSGNIRNPWDWYVSLWAFGSMKKGALYEMLIEKRWYKKIKHPQSFFTPVAEWKKVYSNVEDKALFRQWLSMLLKKRRKDIIGFGNKNIPNNIGLMTFRYLQLYSYDFNENVNLLNDFSKLKTFDEQYNFIDHFIYNDNLEKDFIELMDKAGIDKTVVNELIKMPKTNTSKRDSYQQYYDQETIDIVAQSDKLIIDKHNFIF